MASFRKSLPFLLKLWSILLGTILLGAVVNLFVIWLTGGQYWPSENAVALARENAIWIFGFFLVLGLLTLLAQIDVWCYVDLSRFAALGATVKYGRDLTIGLTGDVPVDQYHDDSYIIRDVDTDARESLRRQGGVIIIGRPSSGKTRLAWNLLREHPDTLIVKPYRSEPQGSLLPLGLRGKDVVLLFDDLHATELLQSLAWCELFNTMTGQRPRVIATTRDGQDWERVEDRQSLLLRWLGDPACRVYTSQVGNQGADLSVGEGWTLAQRLHPDLSWEEFTSRFDGTPGSLTLDLGAMRRRYARLCDDAFQTGLPLTHLLDAAKLLYQARQPRLVEPLLRDVAERIFGDGPIKPGFWRGLKERTEGFGRFDANGEFRTYRPYLEKCIDYQPQWDEVKKLVPILIEREDAEGLFYLGIAANAENDQLLAENAWRYAGAYGADPAWVNLGVLLSKQRGRASEAEDAYLRAIEADPDHAYTLGNYARFLSIVRNDHDRAEEYYQRAIKADPDHAYTLGNYARFLSDVRNDHDRAEEYYQRAIKADPDRAYTLGNYARFLSIVRNDYDRAEEYYQRAIKADPDHAYTLGNYARFLSIVRNDYDRAEEYYQRAIKADPDHAYTLGNYARFLKNVRNDHDRAEEL